MNNLCKKQGCHTSFPYMIHRMDYKPQKINGALHPLLSAILVIIGVALSLASPLFFFVLDSHAIAMCLAIIIFFIGLFMSLFAYDRSYTKAFNLIDPEDEPSSFHSQEISSSMWGRSQSQGTRHKHASSH